MNVLFVHGMGRSPLSGWPMLRELTKAGFKTNSFGYFVSMNSFDDIKISLQQKITELSKQGDYVLIGHSLGGVLIRAALNSMPIEIKQPKQLFLLGSPINPSRLAIKLSSNFIFKGLTRDCGKLLGSAQRMNTISKVATPTTSIVGTKPMFITKCYFKSEINDGVVSYSEVKAEWFKDEIHLPIIHGALPASRDVARIIIRHIKL